MFSKVFLSAHWQNLIMANYAVDVDILKKHVPNGTELDLWNDQAFVSLVGFQFWNTRLLGVPIPFHQNFEEVNLRFYVRYKSDTEGWKRGAVFFKEIVPKPMITLVANGVYGEHYQTLRMKHFVEKIDNSLNVKYLWKYKNHWNSLSVTADALAKPIPKGSEAEFIAEHYWGYTQISDRKTSEYQVAHPRWRAHEVHNFEINCQFDKLYGAEFGHLATATPTSVFMAEGSDVEVLKRQILKR